jgi:hypothetical protein
MAIAGDLTVRTVLAVVISRIGREVSICQDFHLVISLISD